jgi:hypothetical protein
MLYVSDEDSLHVLNATARRIYEWIRQGDDQEAIVQRLSGQYSNMEPERLEADVGQCLKELKARQLLPVIPCDKYAWNSAIMKEKAK